MPQIDALLINPISTRMIPAFVPHGLLYIAAFAIKCGYRVEVYDRNVDDRDIKETISDTQPKVVGIGCLTGTSINDAIYISEQIKKISPFIRIVWGGIHTTLYPDSVLIKDFVDFVVVGDGEYAFAAILDRVIKNNLSLESIVNLGYKEGGRLKYNKTSFVDMDRLPQPAWQLIKVDNYIRRKFYARRVLTINTSRGCPYKCSFCCAPRVHSGKWRGVSAERIIENLKYLKGRYQIDGFQVDDDEFDIDRLRVLKFCQLLESDRLDLKWSHFSRINIVREEVLKREIECGLSLVEFGVESGSVRMLHFLNKNQTVEQIKNVYSICRRLQLKTSALFMVGLPTETLEELGQTVKLIKQLKPHLTICTPYKPYPGTELFDYCVDKRLFKYPDRLESASKAYEQLTNMSAMPDGIIIKTKHYFDLRNIRNELKFILTRMKFVLFFYYLFRYILKPKQKTLE